MRNVQLNEDFSNNYYTDSQVQCPDDFVVLAHQLLINEVKDESKIVRLFNEPEKKVSDVSEEFLNQNDVYSIAEIESYCLANRLQFFVAQKGNHLIDIDTIIEVKEELRKANIVPRSFYLMAPIGQSQVNSILVRVGMNQYFLLSSKHYKKQSRFKNWLLKSKKHLLGTASMLLILATGLTFALTNSILLTTFTAFFGLTILFLLNKIKTTQENWYQA